MVSSHSGIVPERIKWGGRHALADFGVFTGNRQPLRRTAADLVTDFISFSQTRGLNHERPIDTNLFRPRR